MVTKEEVRAFNDITDDFLCSAEDNIYDISIVGFTIRDLDRSIVLMEGKMSDDPSYQNVSRSIKYHFGPAFFDLKHIGTTVDFTVGDKPVKDFCIIERHYFDGHMLKSFEFTFPFCIPKTQNSFEQLYELPDIDSEMKQRMINSPYETKSDTFFFVGDKLVMHQKAEYSYAP